MFSIGIVETKTGSFDILKLFMSAMSLSFVTVILVIMAILPIDPMWTYIVGTPVVIGYIYYSILSITASIRRNLPKLTV
jgi:hypothetical protein